MNNEAVLDLNTGLVWQRSPPTALEPWDAAFGFCDGQLTGGVMGWRLPKLQELASLTDLSVYATPTATALGMKVLPPGHPFINVQIDYWTATTWGPSPSLAWYVSFARNRTLAPMITPVNTAPKANLMLVWCVRGRAGGDVQ